MYICVNNDRSFLCGRAHTNTIIDVISEFHRPVGLFSMLQLSLCLVCCSFVVYSFFSPMHIPANLSPHSPFPAPLCGRPQVPQRRRCPTAVRAAPAPIINTYIYIYMYI